MIRKVQESGRLHYISLPADWVKENNIKQGNEVELLVEGRNIMLSSQNQNSQKKSLELNISNTDIDSLTQLIRSCFESGADNIIIHLMEKLNEKEINSLKKKIQKDYGIQMAEITKDCIKIQIVMQGNDVYTLLRAIISSLINALRAFLSKDKEMLDSHVEQVQFYRHLIRRTIRISKKFNSLAIICEELGLVSHELQHTYEKRIDKKEFYDEVLNILQKILKNGNCIDDYLKLYEEAKKLIRLSNIDKGERQYQIDRIRRAINLTIKELISEKVAELS